MARVADPDQIWSKRKAIIALFPYIVRQDRDGDHGMVDAFLGITRAPKIVALLTEQITTLFEEASPDPPNRVVTLMSPHASWGRLGISDGNTVTWWAAAALAVPYTEEVGQSVVDTLLQIASQVRLRPYIPTEIWAWLKKRPSLPPICSGRSMGTRNSVVSWVRELGDVEILESYLLLVWSEWDYVYEDVLVEMRSSIREDFGGIGMGRHREALVKQLDHVLGQLDRGLGHFTQQNPLIGERHIRIARKRYGELRKVLLEVDKEASEILTRTSFRLINLFDLLIPTDLHRIPLDVHLCTPSPIPVVVSTTLASRSPDSALRLHIGSLSSLFDLPSAIRGG